jgi:hypothetical protein
MPAPAGKDAGPKVALRAIECPRTPPGGDRRPAFRVGCCGTGHWQGPPMVSSNEVLLVRHGETDNDLDRIHAR